MAEKMETFQRVRDAADTSGIDLVIENLSEFSVGYAFTCVTSSIADYAISKAS
jgi:hypothetical protein